MIMSLIAVIFGCNRSEKQKSEIQLLNVGFQNSPSNSLLMIAYEKDLFDKTKIKVNIKEFSAGKLALQSLLGQSNDLDLAVSAETPIVLSTLSGNKFKVISQIVNANNECRVVVRKSSNDKTVEEYFKTPHKIATSIGASPEWFTYNFIKRNNINKDNLEVIAMLPENMPVSIINGSIDGISIYDPYARIAERELGDKCLTFTLTDITSYYLLSVKENVLTEKKEAIKVFLTGLSKASEFIRNSPEESKLIVSKRTKIDVAILNETWMNYSFDIGFDSNLINLFRQESNWAIESGKYPKGTRIPDFNDIILPDLLDANIK